MAQFSGRQNNLAAMVSLVGYKIDHEVYDIRGNIAPRNPNVQCAVVIKARIEQPDNSFAARFRARSNCARLTRLRSTLLGALIPYCFPTILIHMHLALWIWPAIIRMVRCGEPGTFIFHKSPGRFSKKNPVTRLLVRHVANMLCR